MKQALRPTQRDNGENRHEGKGWKDSTKRKEGSFGCVVESLMPTTTKHSLIMLSVACPILLESSFSSLGCVPLSLSLSLSWNEYLHDFSH